MSHNPLWKTENATHIIKTAEKINAGELTKALVERIVQDKIMRGNTPLMDGGVSPIENEFIEGYMGSVVTGKELMERATSAAPYELWWCRAVAEQIKLNVSFMDWFWYSHQADKEVDINLLSSEGIE